MKLIDDYLLDKITEVAKINPRLRMNFNFHANAESRSQRLLNVLMPGTKIPVHRHRHTSETYILVRGRMRVIFYDEHGAEKTSEILDHAEGKYGIHIPQNVWHSVEVLTPVVIFEAKDGPYTPLEESDIMHQIS